MARKPRQEMEGGLHHVYARGNDRRRIFVDDVDRTRYCALLAATVVRARWRCLAYCLMPNHVHLLIETPEPTLGYGMQRLHGDYARHFNRRHGRTGHVFQGRYGAVRVEDDAQLWMTVAYIARNPTGAGLVDHPAEWSWASHAAVRRGEPPPWLDAGRLLEYIGALGEGDRFRRYLECTEGGDRPARAA